MALVDPANWKVEGGDEVASADGADILILNTANHDQDAIIFHDVDSNHVQKEHRGAGSNPPRGRPPKHRPAHKKKRTKKRKSVTRRNLAVDFDRISQDRRKENRVQGTASKIVLAALPQGDALPQAGQDGKPAIRPNMATHFGLAELLASSLGDRFARCIFSKAWSSRLAALTCVAKYMELLCGSGCEAVDADKIETDLKTDILRIGEAEVLAPLLQTIALGVKDKVEKVYSASLRLLYVVTTAFIPTVGAEHDEQVAMYLAPALETVLHNCCVSKARTREKSIDALVKVLNHIHTHIATTTRTHMHNIHPSHPVPTLKVCGSNSVSNTMTSTFSMGGLMLPIVHAAALERLRSLNATTSHFPLLGVLTLLHRLVARFGVSKIDDDNLNMNVATALAVCAPALANRKAAVRQAALELFAAVYSAAMANEDAQDQQVRLRPISLSRTSNIFSHDALPPVHCAGVRRLYATSQAAAANTTVGPHRPIPSHPPTKRHVAEAARTGARARPGTAEIALLHGLGPRARPTAEVVGRIGHF